MKCELCGREVEVLTLHHLRPKSRRNKYEKVVDLPTARICWPCHRQVHALFTNVQLAEEFSTLQKLRDNELIKSFIAWIRKQDPNKKVKVRK